MACGKKNILMVPGRFLNIFGNGADFVGKDSYQVCSNLLRILQVKHGGNFLLAPTADDLDGLPNMSQEEADDSFTVDR